MTETVCVLVALGIASLLILGIFLLKKLNIQRMYYGRIMALLYAVVSFAVYIYEHSAVYFVKGLNHPTSPFETPSATAFGIILLWLSYAGMLATVMNEFFEFKTLKRIVNLFSLPLSACLLIFFKTWATAQLGTDYSLGTVRLWLMTVSVGLGLALILSRMILDRDVELPRSMSEVGNMLYGLVFAILGLMPCYVPQAFLYELDPNLKLFDFTEEHRFMIYGAVIIPFIIFHMLKNKSQDIKRFVLIYMSVATLWVYIGRWTAEMLARPTSWPLHLCNTAMFLIPLCLIFKMDRLFNFCLFINVMGAFLAMMLPGELSGLNIIGTERVSFWLNHYIAFFLPVLAVALKVFKRPKFKEWVYAVIALTVYFCAMLFTNAYFTVKYPGTEVDFFFLNSDFIVSSLGQWAEKTMLYELHVPFGEYTLTFYPLYQALFYLVYVGLTVGIWFLYELLFKLWDASEDRRLRERDYKRMKKELNEFLGGRSIHEPISGDASPRLVINHFSKRYGANKHYSVNDVSFEVHAGEIFGFLGPNGAGKSTIIKSMVGIQTITSGDIEICGYSIERQPVQAKLHSGFVPDHYALYENLTGREYINYIADLYQVNAEYRNEMIEKYVERFQLTGSFDNQIKTYSHGMKQKITILAALVHNPKVWILDEPLTGLDPTSIHEVKECMKEHAQNGNIVFFSSHIIDVVEKICDRIAIIKKGQLRACVSIKELEQKGIELEQFYLDIINDGSDEHVPYVEDTTAREATV